jgi:hypothetical protein
MNPARDVMYRYLYYCVNYAVEYVPVHGTVRLCSRYNACGWPWVPHTRLLLRLMVALFGRRVVQVLLTYCFTDLQVSVRGRCHL